MKIRTYQAGDENQQLEIYNTVAARLPGYKIATSADILRRIAAPDFDPSARLYAERDGQIVGYCTWQANGRISYPWCRPGSEEIAGELLETVLQAMTQRQIPTAMAAYRNDWTAQHAFLLAHGFHRVREMVNFVQPMIDLPTTVNRRGANITTLRESDLPAIAEFVKPIVRLSQAQLQSYLLANPYFAVESVYVLRRPDDTPQAICIFIENPQYADPTKVDVQAPCFRLGAFGTEGQNTKRINGMFSFLAAPDRELTLAGLDLLWHVNAIADPNGQSILAAQLPSDATMLLSFYQKYFRKQGSFPIFEKPLT